MRWTQSARSCGKARTKSGTETRLAGELGEDAVAVARDRKYGAGAILVLTEDGVRRALGEGASAAAYFFRATTNGAKKAA
jgi:hypothetical protein